MAGSPGVVSTASEQSLDVRRGIRKEYSQGTSSLQNKCMFYRAELLAAYCPISDALVLSFVTH